MVYHARSDARCRPVRAALVCLLALTAGAVLLSAAGGLLLPATALARRSTRSTRSTAPTRPTWAARYPSGGGGLPPIHKPKRGSAHPPSKEARGTWLRGVTITEYWPAPERWFVGEPVSAPGLVGEHRIDWLYSAMGVSMEGEGIGLDGRMYHVDALGDGGWVTADGAPTSPSDGWSAGAPYWRAGGYWHSPTGAVTFPLAAGGWSAGVGREYVPLEGVTFAPGPALPLRYYQSIAVDPAMIPLGRRVYIPAYRHDGHGGWFLAQDAGGAIGGAHIDVYRPPPVSPTVSGRHLTRQRMLVIKPRR
jgi:3D (Asp-Asp-Asp) domain-containing protein